MLYYTPDDPEEQQKKLDRLAKCNCCATHKLNKPYIYAPWVEVLINKIEKNHISNTKPDGTCICDCKCRMNARFICRQYCDYNTSTVN